MERLRHRKAQVRQLHSKATEWEIKDGMKNLTVSLVYLFLRINRCFCHSLTVYAMILMCNPGRPWTSICLPPSPSSPSPLPPLLPPPKCWDKRHALTTPCSSSDFYFIMWFLKILSSLCLVSKYVSHQSKQESDIRHCKRHFKVIGGKQGSVIVLTYHTWDLHLNPNTAK